ncbi:fimbria/pilus periplasmic chaperone [Kalamiella sp. sgz302252]|uniref:fimbria/pilus periplasmic chaperone n=1 Tax=Pantoea sp. sgz302252 TaxID=3341827 RepID=UPI0036D3AF23
MLKKTLFSVAMLAALVCQHVYAGGIAPGATRIIYAESDSQASIPVTNSDDHERYLIQAWVEDENGQRVKDFVVTPPLFAAAPKSENNLRIVYIGAPLPKDREKVYWMNVKAIPSINKEELSGANTLQLAVLSRMKLFMRPDGLPFSEMDSVQKIHFQIQQGKLLIENPTPYYQSLVNISVGGKKLKNSMVAPFDRLSLALPKGAAGPVHYQSINDYGAVSAPQTGGL